MNKKLLIIPVLLVLLLIAYFVFSGSREDDSKLVLSGNIEITDAQLSFKIPGRLAERLAGEGEEVTEGQLVARLEDNDQELSVTRAQANLDYAEAVLAEIEAGSRSEDIARTRAQVSQADARLRELLEGTRSQEIAVAEANVERARAGLTATESQLELARNDFERYSELLADGVVSQREFEATETQYQLAQSTYEEALAGLNASEEALDLAMEGATPEQIDQARAGVAQAMAALDLLEAGPRIETIQQAMAQVDIALNAVDTAEQQLEYTNLYSPFDGYVLSKSAEPGEYLNPGSTVVTVGQLDTVWLRAYVSEVDLGRINLGMQVEVVTDTYPDSTYTGTISFISSEAEFTPKSVQTTEERTKLMYMVKVELANPDLELKPGMPADCVIDLG